MRSCVCPLPGTRRVLEFVFRANVGLVVEEQFDHLMMAVRGRVMESRYAVHVWAIGVDTSS